MLSSLSSLFVLIVSLLLPSVLSSPIPFVPPAAHALTERYYPQGTISTPANGTVIMPGASFDFFYHERGDYCLSSMNFSVWLLTSSPSSVLGLMDDGEVTGWYFGRFAYSSVSNEFPKNPAPAQLTMPDFSKPMGGFSSGANASSAPMYLAVMEEWNSCVPTIGHQFSLTANSIVYNATNASAST